MLCPHAEYNLPFAAKSKPLVANKGTKSLNLLPRLLILVRNTVNCPLLAPIRLPR